MGILSHTPRPLPRASLFSSLLSLPPPLPPVLPTTPPRLFTSPFSFPFVFLHPFCVFILPGLQQPTPSAASEPRAHPWGRGGPTRRAGERIRAWAGDGPCLGLQMQHSTDGTFHPHPPSGSPLPAPPGRGIPLTCPPRLPHPHITCRHLLCPETVLGPGLGCE